MMQYEFAMETRHDKGLQATLAENGKILRKDINNSIAYSKSAR